MLRHPLSDPVSPFTVPSDFLAISEPSVGTPPLVLPLVWWFHSIHSFTGPCPNAAIYWGSFTVYDSSHLIQFTFGLPDLFH